MADNGDVAVTTVVKKDKKKNKKKDKKKDGKKKDKKKDGKGKRVKTKIVRTVDADGTAVAETHIESHVSTSDEQSPAPENTFHQEDIDEDSAENAELRRSQKEHAASGVAASPLADGGDDGDFPPPAHGDNEVVIHVNARDEHRTALKINEGWTGKHLLRAIAHKFELVEHQYFDLAVDEPDGSSRWIDREAAVLDQGIDGSSSIMLKVRYFVKDVANELTDPAALWFYYHEVRFHVLSGAWPVDHRSAVSLAAFSLQEKFGDFDPEVHVPGFLHDDVGLDQFVAADHIPDSDKKQRKFQQELLDAFELQVGSTTEVAQLNYVLFSVGLPGYGAAFFDAEFDGANARVGIVPEGVATFGPGNRRLSLIPFSRVTESAFDGSRLSISHTEHDGSVSTTTVRSTDGQAEALAKLFDGYRALQMVGTAVTTTYATADERSTTVRVHTCDDEYRVLRVDGNTTGEELMAEFARRFELEDFRYFALFDSSAASDRWLHPEKRVLDQFVTKDSKLVFKLQFFFVTPEEMASVRDPVARHLYYVQFKQMVLDAVWDIHHDIAADMACRITLSSFGRYEEEVHVEGFLERYSMAKFIPYTLVEHPSHNWEREIFSLWAATEDFTVELVEDEYLEMCQSINMYGSTLFDVFMQDSSGKRKKVVCAIQHLGIAILTHKHRELIMNFSYATLNIRRATDKFVIFQMTGEKGPDGAPVWNQHDFYTLSPMQGQQMTTLAKTYHKVLRHKYQQSKA